MKRILEKIFNGIGGLLVVFISFSWIIGAVHAYKKHSKIDFGLALLTPYSVYMSAEMFWCKEKKKSKTDEFTKQERELINITKEWYGSKEMAEKIMRSNKEMLKAGHDFFNKYDSIKSKIANE